MEILDLYDNNFKNLNKTIVRRVEEIPKDTNIMLSYAIIKNGDSYLLEQTTNRNGYKWCFAGGHLQHNEDDLMAIKRELKEEIGLTDIKLTKIDMLKHPNKNFIFNIYLITKDINTNKLQIQKDEVTKVKWFTKEDLEILLENNAVLEPHKLIIRKYIFKR